MRRDRVYESVDGEPFEHHDPPGVVHTGDQLAYPDSAELPVGEFRRCIRRGGFPARHAEHRSFQHGRLDRLALGWTGGAAGQDLQRHNGFGLGVSPALVTTLQPGDGRHQRRRQ